MKTFLKVIAWLGLSFMILSTALQFGMSWNLIFPNPDVTRRGGIDLSPFFAIFAGIGLLFMLVGGLIVKPRYFWLASIVVGLLNIASFWGVWLELDYWIDMRNMGAFFFCLSFALPGLLAIFEGYLIKKLEMKKRRA